MLYKFIDDHTKDFPIQKQCSVLEVSKSGYYGWLKGRSHQPSPAEVHKRQQIISTFEHHRSRYGTRRIVAALAEQGLPLSRSKVRGVLKQQGLKAIQPRSFVPRTTDSRHSYPISPNLLLERDAPQRVNEVWVGDITYIPLAEGRWAYLSVWMDLYSRKIVGWELMDHMKEELVIAAMQKALHARRPAAGLIIHSDRGGQYGSKAFRRLLGKGIRQSMSRADNVYDNVFMESCFSRFKTELLQGGMFQTIEDAYTEIFEYIEMYYNTERLHSSLGYKSPVRFEAEYQKSKIVL